MAGFYRFWLITEVPRRALLDGRRSQELSVRYTSYERPPSTIVVSPCGRVAILPS
jgi:hypothetical protein